MPFDRENALRNQQTVDQGGQPSTFDERLVEAVASPHEIERHRDRYRLAADLVAGMQVLDIACGTGYGARLMKDGGAASVVGIDLQPDVISYASETYGCDGVAFEVGDACGLDLGRTFPAIVSFETIEHLSDAGAFLDTVCRHLAPDGLFIVSSPWCEPGLAKPRNPHHVKEWTPEEFKAMLGEHFDNVEVRVQNPYLRTRLMGLRITRRIPRLLLRGAKPWPDPMWREHSLLRGIYPPSVTKRYWVAGRAEYVIALCRSKRP